jgi:hypothetical protein
MVDLYAFRGDSRAATPFRSEERTMSSFIARARAILSGDINHLPAFDGPDGTVYTPEDIRRMGQDLERKNQQLESQNAKLELDLRIATRQRDEALARVAKLEGMPYHQRMATPATTPALKVAEPTQTRPGRFEEDAPVPRELDRKRARNLNIVDAAEREAQRKWDHYLTLTQAQAQVLQLAGLPATWVEGMPAPARKHRKLNVQPIVEQMQGRECVEFQRWVGRNRPVLQGAAWTPPEDPKQGDRVRIRVR